MALWHLSLEALEQVLPSKESLEKAPLAALTIVAVIVLQCLMVVIHNAIASARRTRTKCLPPPHVPGLPLLGNVLALGKGGCNYLHACRREVRTDLHLFIILIFICYYWLLLF
jgi:hypothetical protein